MIARCDDYVHPVKHTCMYWTGASIQHSVVTDSGVQGLTQSLPESLQKFNLNLESPR